MSIGKFGQYDGQFVLETLMSAIQELEAAYNKYGKDPGFIAELNDLHKDYTGCPSLLYCVGKATRDLGEVKIYLKRGDLSHIDSHKINNAPGQVLLAKKMGKAHVTAETGAGQHGVAIAIAATLLGMECEVFMGKEGTDRQALNVFRMQLFGVKIRPATSGTQTLKDAANETMKGWTNWVEDIHYVLGSAMGPHPFPTITRGFQSTIGKEIREQLLKAEGKSSSMVIACVGDGSSAMGAFYEFINGLPMALVGCEAAGKGIETEQHTITICKGPLGIFHSMEPYLCQDECGQITSVYSISAGLDYPSIGPEHINLHDTDRASHVPVMDGETVNTFQYLSRVGGIILVIKSVHAVSYARKVTSGMSRDDIIVINLPGRGDRDVAAIAKYMGVNIYRQDQ